MKRILFLLLSALCLSTQSYGKVQFSTTLPETGKPEHVYTMVNGQGVYSNGNTTPTDKAENYGLFAFYAAENVEGACYIYSYTAKKWLSYTPASSYNNGKDFIKLTDSKNNNAYFKLNNYSEEYYEMSPYTTAGTTDKFLNWFQGVTGNPYNGTNTLGLYSTGGSGDAGSRYTFTEIIIETHTYTITVPEGVTLKIGDKEYENGSQISVDGIIDRSTITVIAPEGKFAIVSVNDTENTITVNVVTLPEQPACEPYTNAWVYPKQQDNVGIAKIIEEDDVYTLYNNVLAASFMKVGEAIYFAGSDAMNLVAGTEPFTVAFGNGDIAAASDMTLKNIATENLTANASAIGGAEHYNGVQIVANYEYTYNEAKIEIVWRAVLRDGSHYLRTEMELKGVDDVDMYNVIPMIYNVDTDAAGSTPKVVGNTRGATIVSDKIFAGLETPTAYNTVGGATGEEDLYNKIDTKTEQLTADSWKQVEEADVPFRVSEATGAGYPNIYAYTMTGIELKKNQKVTILAKYKEGSHRLNFGGADIVNTDGAVAANDYHKGYSGSQHDNNTFTFTAPYDGTFSIRVFAENKSESINASSTMTVDIYEPKEGAVINTSIVGIQGRWSRNTTLAAGETWKVGAVVGLIAQDGKQSEANIRNTQKRRSFLAYSERERAVPWRAFPCYISWYELNINRNNADPGKEHLDNMKAVDVLDVLSVWKTQFFDKYGEGPAAFIIDDGWDNYGTWTFHEAFPNEMRDIAAQAKEMGAGVGAWLGPVGGYGGSGNHRRNYWSGKGGMQLSNPAYYQVFKDAAYNLVCNQDGQDGLDRSTDNYMFFKFDGISAQFSATGPDGGDTGNENAEGIIRLERYVREELREDIFFNTTVGTWASPFWYQISDATWRQENDHGHEGNNTINREKWITYRDRLVYQNYVSNSPLCPINTLMTHGFILTKFGPPAGDSRDYNAVLRELRCAFVCGSGMVELYNDYDLMNSINGGKLWEDLAECIAWQKKNADVLPDAHWVGGNPWNGSVSEVYGWASWNGAQATLALRNGANDAQTYTFTLREALEIPANITGKIIFNKSFKVQDALEGFAEGTEIDIDEQLTVELPASSVFAFDGMNADLSQVPFKIVGSTPKSGVEALSEVSITFNSNIKGEYNAQAENAITLTKNGEVICGITGFTVNGATLNITLAQTITAIGEYTLVIPEGIIARSADEKPFSGELTLTVIAPKPIEATSVTPDVAVTSLSEIQITFNKEIAFAGENTTVELKDANNAVVTTGACKIENNKTLVVTFANKVSKSGEFTLEIPEGIIIGKALSDSYSGLYTFNVDVYIPRHTGTKSMTGRNISEIKLTSNEYGESKYELSSTEQTQDYLDVTASVVFKAAPGEEVQPAVTAGGVWRNHYIYIDFDGDGFTAGIESGSNWKPAGDLVAYSFYNNDAVSDDPGWNSKGSVLTGGNRSTPSIPSFTAPAQVGRYRMRIKQDWCNIDPAGDNDGKFGDFKANGGQIIDIILEVGNVTNIEFVGAEKDAEKIYDLTGRQIEKTTTRGIYIINGKKVLVK